MTVRVNPKFGQLLRELLEFPDVVTWQETPSDERFVAVLKNGCVEIEKQSYLPNELADEVEIFSATLLDRSGRVLESISSNEFDDEQLDSILRRLFSSARSQSRKSDQVLDNLIEEIHSVGQ